MAQDTHAKSAHDAHHEEQVEREIGASSEPKWKHALDADEAMVAVSALGNVEIDDATNKRLLRRIDMRLMPLLCLVYALNFLDKSTLSFASVMGMKEDIRLKGDNYQWLSSMFYFGYLAWEYPTNLLLQRLPLAKYSAFCIIIWGVVLCCFATVSNFGETLALRFFLGVFEAGVTPGFAFITSQWYTKKEQGFRTGIWFSFNGIGIIVGSLLAYGIAQATKNHATTIAPWKILFVSTGVFTIVIGIVFLFVMPDSQLNARWLSDDDKRLAVERVRINEQGIGNKHFKWYQFKEAMLDPMTWAFAFFALASGIPIGGVTNFFSQLIVGFGFTADQSLLLSCPAGAVAVITLVGCGYLGDRYSNRILYNSLGLVVAIVGILLILALPLSNKGGRLAGYYLMYACSPPFTALLSLISTNVAGHTKKTTVAAIYLIAYCAGLIIGPQTFRPQDAPRYVPAEITIICCWAACFVDMALIYWYYTRQNRNKAVLRAEPGYAKLENQEFLDLTDRENPELVYTL